MRERTRECTSTLVACIERCWRMELICLSAMYANLQMWLMWASTVMSSERMKPRFRAEEEKITLEVLTRIDIVRNSTAHSIALAKRGCSDVNCQAKNVTPKTLYVMHMFTTVWWLCRLDLDLNPLYLKQEHPLLTHAQWFPHYVYWSKLFQSTAIPRNEEFLNWSILMLGFGSIFVVSYVFVIHTVGV